MGDFATIRAMTRACAAGVPWTSSTQWPCQRAAVPDPMYAKNGTFIPWRPLACRGLLWGAIEAQHVDRFEGVKSCI